MTEIDISTKPFPKGTTMSATPNKSITRFLPVVGRILFGLALTAFGLMDLFHPMTPPPDMAEGAKEFSMALAHSGYMMPLIGIVLTVCGVMLLTNLFVPLALLVLAPFWVNSFLFHLVLERSGLVFAMVFCAIELALAWAYRGVFANVLRAKNATGA